MTIGNQNVFEVKSIVNAHQIGDANVFESNCESGIKKLYSLLYLTEFLVGFVGEEVRVGNGTSFGAGTTVTTQESIPDNSVFFGNPLRHRIANDRPQVKTGSYLTMESLKLKYNFTF